MKKLEEMTDQELARELLIQVRVVIGGSVFDEAIRRLSTHPAQRIADLTGCVVTKDEDGSWKQWSPEATIDDLVIRSTYHDHYTNDEENVHIEFFDIGLPDDNRPWQESIYKPRVK